MSGQLDVRGAVVVVVHGRSVNLLPTFRNLAQAEQATGKTAITVLSQMMAGNVSIVDVAKIITACGVPVAPDSALPKPWNHQDIGQYMLDEGYAPYLTAVITMLGAALSAAPKKRVDSGVAAAPGEG